MGTFLQDERYKNTNIVLPFNIAFFNILIRFLHLKYQRIVQRKLSALPEQFFFLDSLVFVLSKIGIGGSILAMPVPDSCIPPSLNDWFTNLYVSSGFSFSVYIISSNCLRCCSFTYFCQSSFTFLSGVS